MCELSQDDQKALFAGKENHLTKVGFTGTLYVCKQPGKRKQDVHLPIYKLAHKSRPLGSGEQP